MRSQAKVVKPKSPQFVVCRRPVQHLQHWVQILGSSRKDEAAIINTRSRALRAVRPWTMRRDQTGDQATSREMAACNSPALGMT